MIQVIVVDDEPLARQVIERYVALLDYLSLKGSFGNAIEASNFLSRNTVDVMFLDIQMPALTGLDFIKTLRHPPKIILTTAFSQYALESYELNVTDYLLKPVSFDRFLKTIHKIQGSQESAIVKPVEAADQAAFIFLKADKKIFKVAWSDILHVEGYGNYLKVHTRDKLLVVNEKMSDLLTMLPANVFIRVHKSFIINLRSIDFIEGNTITVSGKQVPVSETYRAALDALIHKK